MTGLGRLPSFTDFLYNRLAQDWSWPELAVPEKKTATEAAVSVNDGLTIRLLSFSGHPNQPQQAGAEEPHRSRYRHLTGDVINNWGRRNQVLTPPPPFSAPGFQETLFVARWIMNNSCVMVWLHQDWRCSARLPVRVAMVRRGPRSRVIRQPPSGKPCAQYLHQWCSPLPWNATPPP
jgi:hypothetical protein